MLVAAVYVHVECSFVLSVISSAKKAKVSHVPCIHTPRPLDITLKGLRVRVTMDTVSKFQDRHHILQFKEEFRRFCAIGQ